MSAGVGGDTGGPDPSQCPAQGIAGASPSPHSLCWGCVSLGGWRGGTCRQRGGRGTGWPGWERVPMSLGSVQPEAAAPSLLPAPARGPPGPGGPRGVLTPLSLLCLFQALSPATRSLRLTAAVPRIRPAPPRGDTHTHLCTLYDARRVPAPLHDNSSPSLAHGPPPAFPFLSLPGGWGVGSEPPPCPSPPALVSPSDKEQQFRILVPL